MNKPQQSLSLPIVSEVRISGGLLGRTSLGVSLADIKSGGDWRSWGLMGQPSLFPIITQSVSESTCYELPCSTDCYKSGWRLKDRIFHQIRWKIHCLLWASLGESHRITSALFYWPKQSQRPLSFQGREHGSASDWKDCQSYCRGCRTENIVASIFCLTCFSISIGHSVQCLSHHFSSFLRGSFSFFVCTKYILGASFPPRYMCYEYLSPLFWGLPADALNGSLCVRMCACVCVYKLKFLWDECSLYAVEIIEIPFTALCWWCLAKLQNNIITTAKYHRMLTLI